MAIEAHLYPENLDGFYPLGSAQDFMMENGCRFNEFSVNLEPQKQQNQTMHYPLLQNLPERNQDFPFVDRFSRPDYNPSAVFSRTMESQFQKHSKEIDLLISLQNERLRLALQEQRKQQIFLLLKDYELKAQFLLQQKDEEIAKALNRAIELEDLVKKIEIENQTWQRVAKENEAVIVSLKNTMEELRKGAAFQSGENGVEDAESCCEIMIEQTRKEPEQQENGMMICKLCNFRSSCVILLPCRHLCSCNVCEAFIESCPVCNMVKKASIEAII